MEENKNENIFINLQKVPLKSEREEKKAKVKRTILVVFLCILFFVLGCFGGYINNRLKTVSSRYHNNAVMSEIEYIISNYWLYGDEHEDLLNEMEDKALYGMSTFLEDPFTSYMSSKEVNDFYSSINRDYVGIGVEYTYADGIFLIRRVFKDSPAEKGGILPGDIIKEVNHEDVEGCTSDELKELVLGEAGSEVTITVRRVNELLDFTLTRAAVSNSVYAYMEDNCLIMEISSFGDGTAKECMSYLDEYEDLDSIIIDLRDNTGGLQTSVKEVCGLFIGNNKVYLRQAGKDGNEYVDYTKCEKTYENFKNIIILVNGNTASASEVFTICLKEQLDNVTIVGETTYGKGVIQSQKNLSNGGSLKFTTYYWYSPNGNSIHLEGIKPDFEVKMPDIYYESYSILDDDARYEYDCVDDNVRTIELALNYLGYYDGRSDGYFGETLKVSLNRFKIDNNLGNDSVIDKQTYEAIISKVSYEIINNKDKDTQMNKAKELVHGYKG